MSRVLGTTLLLAGLSLATSPELLAEEAAEGEPESSEEPTQDLTEVAPTESLPPTDDSDWEADLDAMIEEAKRKALENKEDRTADAGSASQQTEDQSEETQRLEESTAEPHVRVAREAGQVAVYIEGATLVLINGLVFNGEVSLSKHLSISGGWGVSKARLVDRYSAQGPRLQIHYLAGGGAHLFELAIGGALSPWQHHFVIGGEQLVPTFHVGYRWQPPRGGVLFRGGISFPQHNNSGGLSLSLGKAF